MSANSASSTSMLFGKLPCRGDFVRSGSQGAAELAFESWLGAAVEQSGGALPASGVRFLLTPVSGESPLVGVWTPSRDEVGRDFPLAYVQRVPADLESVPWPVLPAYYARFLDDAERCLERGLREQLAWVRSALDRIELAGPHPSSLPGLLHQSRQALTQERVGAFTTRVFAPSAVEPLSYALGTLERAGELADDALTLDLPSSCAADMFVWLELLRVLLGDAKRPRALVWTWNVTRVLVCPGALSEQLIAFLRNPQHRSSRRWPLWTESATAGTAAREALSARARRVLHGDAPLSELVAAVSEGRKR